MHIPQIQETVMIICGGRRYNDREAMAHHVARAAMMELESGHCLSIVHGGAKGADTLAGDAADELGLRTEVFEADWGQHGRSAGHVRNQEMARHLVAARKRGAKVCVVAFPGGVGTENMRTTAKKVGISVFSPVPVA
jgi:hypothetical protein